MSLIDFILTRRSIRHYDKKAIPEDILNQIFEAGRNAPSAANRQPIHFIIVNNDDAKKELSKGMFNRHIKDSPAVIVGCADVNSALTGNWAIVDAAIAMQNMVLAAWALGIGSCWIGDFREEKVKELLKIPDKWKVVALVSIGYPAEQPKQRKKKPVEELFSFNSF
jgi:nitroreductase